MTEKTKVSTIKPFNAIVLRTIDKINEKLTGKDRIRFSKFSDCQGFAMDFYGEKSYNVADADSMTDFVSALSNIVKAYLMNPVANRAFGISKYDINDAKVFAHVHDHIANKILNNENLDIF